MKPAGAEQDRLQGFGAKQFTRTHVMEFALFIFVGAINTAITFAIYVCLLWLVTYGVAYTISYADTPAFKLL